MISFKKYEQFFFFIKIFSKLKSNLILKLSQSKLNFITKKLQYKNTNIKMNTS